MTYYIGVDLGGTKLNIALVKDGSIVKKVNVETEAEKGKNHVIDNLVNGIHELTEGIDNIAGVGIGVPGTLNDAGDTLLKLPNLRCMENVPLKKILEKKLGMSVAIENDVNALALGELNYGACKGKDYAVCLTLGTGVGGAVIIGGELYRGRGSAGEIGHMTIVPEGELCNCGNKGCLEAYVSKSAFVRESKKIFGKEMDPLEVEKMAKEGDKKAKLVYSNMGDYLGIGFSNIVNILDPEIIVVGGGLGNAGKLILDPARKVLKDRSFLNPPKVVQAKLGADGGVIGASCLVQKD